MKCAPLSISLPLPVFSSVEATTVNPQDAKWLSRVEYIGGVAFVPLPHVTIGLLKPSAP
jgi:hypothetical protein